MLWSGSTDHRLRPLNINFSRPLYIRDIMVANGDAHKPIWISEMNSNAVPNDPDIRDIGRFRAGDAGAAGALRRAGLPAGDGGVALGGRGQLLVLQTALRRRAQTSPCTTFAWSSRTLPPCRSTRRCKSTRLASRRPSTPARIRRITGRWCSEGDWGDGAGIPEAVLGAYRRATAPGATLRFTYEGRISDAAARSRRGRDRGERRWRRAHPLLARRTIGAAGARRCPELVEGLAVRTPRGHVDCRRGRGRRGRARRCSPWRPSLWLVLGVVCLASLRLWPWLPGDETVNPASRFTVLRFTLSRSLPSCFWLSGLRFYRLDAQSFWNDEGNSARIAERTVDLILEGAAGDIHPPGYYLLLHCWRALVGSERVRPALLLRVAGLVLVALHLPARPASLWRGHRSDCGFPGRDLPLCDLLLAGGAHVRSPGRSLRRLRLLLASIVHETPGLHVFPT